MEVTLKATQKRVKKKVVRDHYWYDHITKRRLHGRGGRMVFVYDPVSQRQLPKIIDADEWVYESNYPDIIEWVKDHQNYVRSVTGQAVNHFVSIDVNANDFSSIEDELRMYGIQYDYDVSDFRREVSDNRGQKKWQNSQLRWPIRLPH